MRSPSTTLHTTLFFTRTTLFSAHVNPLLLTLIPFAIISSTTNDLDKAGVLFCMIVLSFTGLLLRPINLTHGDNHDTGTNLSLFYKILPIERSVIHKSLVFSVLLYTTLIYTVLTLLLINSLTLPSLDDLSISYNSETHITYLTGSYHGSRGLLHQFAEYRYPSALFGALQDRSGWPMFPFAVLLLPLFGACSTVFVLLQKIFRPSQNPLLKSVTTTTSITMALLILVLMADIFIPAFTIGKIRSSYELLHGELISSIALTISVCILILGNSSLIRNSIQESSNE